MLGLAGACYALGELEFDEVGWVWVCVCGEGRRKEGAVVGADGGGGAGGGGGRGRDRAGVVNVTDGWVGGRRR